MSVIQEDIANTLYFDRTFNCDAAKISPGEYYYTDKDMLIVTVLGSCVSACIRDTKSGIGGMNHFMLPESGSADRDSPVSESMRYGTYAMEVLINQLLRNGARRENLEAKIFGGGNVLRSFTTNNVGDRNAAFVKQYLKDEGIKVTGEDLLDIYPRKVYYFPKTGKVLVKKLKQLNNYTLVKREQAYSSKLKTNDVGGDIDLF
ncbi:MULTISPECIES: chemoreceptor glutamine deamidase CheD [unclassified Methylophilus]|jgi:chemotaxis protein CheD|uniref:chemoreceptor glutamine deamidase CheD n=1 Tax=unclassified Methylophilus TaxID=2630143 RepID=UPI0006F8D24C|nr:MULTISPECIES: chemoreceptor glutamine deamidase CheD [unclassified Methylophilus]KQT34530.1 chemotaxis protein CheD [Methylophilus sp. Leaf414]KQT37394.1 chemotaxis protein CheD [Methylophilus sp. Leaf416]KQT55437.1 chemotaxis protein CheD [Methylophilus sp. Leaf459]